MLWSLAVLILCQAAGECLHTLTGLPVPGTVIGIALLLSGLCAVGRRIGAAPPLPAADALLGYLPVFFVSPGVCAVMQMSRLVHVWPAVVLGLLGSSVLAFTVTGRLTQALLERSDRRVAAGPVVLKRCSAEMV